MFFSEFPHPVRTIYEPYSHQHQRRLSRVVLSGDGKSILTASDGRGSVLKLWQWSYGASAESDKPTGWKRCIALSHENAARLIFIFMNRFLRASGEVRSSREHSLQSQRLWFDDFRCDLPERNRFRSMGKCGTISICDMWQWRILGPKTSEDSSTFSRSSNFHQSSIYRHDFHWKIS